MYLPQRKAAGIHGGMRYSCNIVSLFSFNQQRQNGPCPIFTVQASQMVKAFS